MHRLREMRARGVFRNALVAALAIVAAPVVVQGAPGADGSAGGDAAQAAPPGQEATAPTAEQSPPPEVPSAVFEEGVSSYKSGSERDAARLLFTYLNGNDQTADHYEWAEYYLAKTLERIGLTHAAVEYYYNVVREQKRPELLPEALRALEQIVATRPFDEELVLVDLISSSEFGALPADVRAFVTYQQGRLDLQQGRRKWAERHFATLSRLQSASELARRYIQKAAFAAAVNTLSETHDKSSIAKRESRDKARSALEAIVASDVDDFAIKNDARRTVARLHFEDGRYTDALKWYEQIEVPFLSREEANLFVEKAWARYYAGDHRGALGILLTLEAPSYRRFFSPERFILKALAYQGLCHYAASKGSAREFLRRYGPTLEELRRQRDPLSDPVIRRAAASEQEPKAVLAFLKRLQYEREQVEKLDEESGLRSHLVRIYDLKIAEVARKLDDVVRTAGESVSEQLLDYEEQARLLDYEISLEVFRRIKKGTGKKIVDEEPPIPLGSKEVYYEFDGEYWNDELHDYRFRIENRCFGERLFQ
jgi:tetratricopeptide (TPR) repeat protein